MAQVPDAIFGNTFANQKASLRIWALFSVAVFSLLVVLSERQLRDVTVAFLFALTPLAFFGATFMFRLQLNADSVSHLFLGRFQISRKPIRDLRRVDIGGSVGAKLTFLDGSSMRFLGADIRVLRDMCNYINERWPDQVEMRWNPALTALLALDRKPDKDANTIEVNEPPGPPPSVPLLTLCTARAQLLNRVCPPRLHHIQNCFSLMPDNAFERSVRDSRVRGR